MMIIEITLVKFGTEGFKYFEPQLTRLYIHIVDYAPRKANLIKDGLGVVVVPKAHKQNPRIIGHGSGCLQSMHR